MADNQEIELSASIDSNMNQKTRNGYAKQRVELKNGDVELGKPSNKVPESTLNWGRIIAIVLATLILVAACAVTWIFQDWQTSLQVFAILVVVYIILFHWEWIYIAIMTAPRDFTALYCYIKILILSKRLQKKDWAMTEIFHENVKKHPDKACFIFQEETWTFKQIEDYSLRVSAVLRKLEIKPNQTVGLMLSNCPELPAIWLGIARVGAITPLINTNQKGNTLLHSINVAKCDAIIYSEEYESAFRDISKESPPDLRQFKFTRRVLDTSKETITIVENAYDFTSMLENTPPEQWKPSEGLGFTGKMLYIYTSGTTGMPKAAVISTSKMLFLASGVHYLGFLKKKDIIYCPMPLYHSAGGCITVGQSLIFGCTVILRTKFSASAYFPDCIKYNATAAHYIGEMCRFLLSTPVSPTDKQHKVRTVYGNGMRPAIWTEFVERFNIKKVVEFYGATEGNANIVNINNRTGAIGFVSRIIPWIYPIAILKVDQDTGEPIRNSKGFCQLAKAGEPGVFIGKIIPNNPSRVYLGYADKKESDKKVIHNVFKKGDSAFISGDLLEADKFGYLFFKDRTGDTFRWKGENVSTTEIEALISKFANQRDAAVYGVEIPGIEGRAGMCGIVDENETLNLNKLAQDISRDLPAYARPVFIRVMTSVDMTGTFKIKKMDLIKEGYNPSKVKDDKLYYLDLKQGKYLPLGHEEYSKIVSGGIRI